MKRWRLTFSDGASHGVAFVEGATREAAMEHASKLLGRRPTFDVVEEQGPEERSFTVYSPRPKS